MYDFDITSEDDFIGEAFIDLSDMKLNEYELFNCSTVTAILI